MKIGNAPERRLEATKASSVVSGGLQEYLKRNPPESLLSGPFGASATSGGLTLGAATSLSKGVDFFPLVSTLVDPETNPAFANDFVASASALAEASTPVEGIMQLAECVEQLPGLPRAASVAVHVLGVLRTAPRAVKALHQPGPKNKVEVSAAIAQVVAALGKLITDCPGLESVKNSAERFAAVVKVGDQICLIPQTTAGMRRISQ